MGMPDSNQQLFTYKDYLTWPDDERWELIEGQPYAMTPAPTDQHQRISIRLARFLDIFFEGKTCEAFHAPFDVRLPVGDEADESIFTVVQPDLLVVCDGAKVDRQGVRGAPDLVIEILSESTSKRDMDLKLKLYEKHGAHCYIIVDPWGQTCTMRLLEPPSKYGDPVLFNARQAMPIPIFPGLIIDLARVFAA